MLYHNEDRLTGLIEDFLGGNRASFDEIIRFSSPDIVNIAYRYLGNLEDAKDIAQEVFVKLYNKLKSFQGQAKFSTWLYRVTVNACIDFLRRQKKVLSLEEDLAGDSQAARQIVDGIDKKDSQRRVAEIIRKLPLRQKNVIILKYFEQLKISQISEVLGCSQSTVKTHLYRAVESLRKELGGES